MFATGLERTVDVCRDRTKLVRNVSLAILFRRVGSCCTDVTGRLLLRRTKDVGTWIWCQLCFRWKMGMGTQETFAHNAGLNSGDRSVRCKNSHPQR